MEGNDLSDLSLPLSLSDLSDLPLTDLSTSVEVKNTFLHVRDFGEPEDPFGAAAAPTQSDTLCNYRQLETRARPHNKSSNPGPVAVVKPKSKRPGKKLRVRMARRASRDGASDDSASISADRQVAPEELRDEPTPLSTKLEDDDDEAEVHPLPLVPGALAGEAAPPAVAKAAERWSGATGSRAYGQHCPSLLPFCLGVLAQCLLTGLLSRAGGAMDGCLDVSDVEARLVRQEKQLSDILQLMQVQHRTVDANIFSKLEKNKSDSEFGADSVSGLRPTVVLASAFHPAAADAQPRQGNDSSDAASNFGRTNNVHMYATALLTWLGLVISFGVLQAKTCKTSAPDETLGAPKEPTFLGRANLSRRQRVQRDTAQ